MRAALVKNTSGKTSGNLSGKAQKASGFASRAGVTPGVPTMTTVAELVARLSDGKSHTLTVDLDPHSPWAVVNTTLDPEKLRPCQKHLWG